MKNISINSTASAYDIFFRMGVITGIDYQQGLGVFLRDELAISNKRKLVIISDDNVHKHYGESVICSLEYAGYTVYDLSIPVGDGSKSLEMIGYLSNKLSIYNINRNDILLALGGGVVGDVTGFLASIYMRGIEYIQLPTSLIAQVDSSIGGKTAVNNEFGKNILGSFYNPKAVVIDVRCLHTLSDYYLIDGMGEVVKYVLIDDLFFNMPLQIQADKDNTDATLRSLILEHSLDIVYKCCQSKKRYIEDDENDRGERRILNFGHTIGHAIEQTNNYNYAHGQCVAMGMYLMTLLSEKYGWTDIGTAQIIKRYLVNMHLFNVKLFDDYNKWLSYIKNDKKNTEKGINIVVLERVGKAIIKKILVDDLMDMIHAVIDHG